MASALPEFDFGLGEAVDMLKKSQRLSLKELRGQAKGTGRGSSGANSNGVGLTARLSKLWANQTARTVIVVVVLVVLYQIFKR